MVEIKHGKQNTKKRIIYGRWKGREHLLESFKRGKEERNEKKMKLKIKLLKSYENNRRGNKYSERRLKITTRR
jgi:hypothetical protein